MKSYAVAVAIAAVVATSAGSDRPAQAQASNGSPYLGEMLLVPYSFCPKGWVAAQGQLLPINQNQALFALIGTTYGGDGKTTFALPHLTAPHSANHAPLLYCISEFGVFPSRS
jgi:microcystin-dependent protein